MLECVDRKLGDSTLDPSTLVDFVKQANDEIGQFKLDNIILSPVKLRSNQYCVPSLTWNSIKFGEAEINKIPNNRRGVYAFVLCEPNVFLPHHGYVLYIGIAGRQSKRSLRQRYREYLNPKKVLKRERIARMIGTWHEVLRFYVAVDNSMPANDLETLEKQLNTALMPPFSEGDLEAKTKRLRRAFK